MSPIFSLLTSGILFTGESFGSLDGEAANSIELAASPSRLPKDSPVNKIPDVKREKIGDTHYYTAGNVKTLEEAVKLRKQMEEKGIKNPVIQKNNK